MDLCDVLKVLSLIYELHDTQLAKEAASQLNDPIMVGGHIHPSDIQAFRFVLRERADPLSLTIQSPNFDGNCFKQFTEALQDIIQPGKVKVMHCCFQHFFFFLSEGVILISVVQVASRASFGCLYNCLTKH